MYKVQYSHPPPRLGDDFKSIWEALQEGIGKETSRKGGEKVEKEEKNKGMLGKKERGLQKFVIKILGSFYN